MLRINEGAALYNLDLVLEDLDASAKRMHKQHCESTHAHFVQEIAVVIGRLEDALRAAKELKVAALKA